jgi:hypothetical protein
MSTHDEWRRLDEVFGILEQEKQRADEDIRRLRPV